LKITLARLLAWLLILLKARLTRKQRNLARKNVKPTRKSLKLTRKMSEPTRKIKRLTRKLTLSKE
jgi:hypothetical protein